MEIVPPQKFKYAHRIAARFTKYDPRMDSFPEPDVAVNLKECSLIFPPAILWCAVYLALWRQRGIGCLLRPPVDRTVSADLAETGLFTLLQKESVHIEGDESDIVGCSDSIDTILPITRFDNLREAAELTNEVEYSLYTSGLGAANIHPVVCELFSEMVNNAAEHSESSVGAYGFIRFYSHGQNRRFVCGVADGGIGIQSSIKRNTNLDHGAYEWSAIELATKELVSGTMSSTRGIGLYSVFEEMRSPGRELLIHSGQGMITMSEDSQIRMIRANLFPGTLVCFSIPA